MKKVIINEFFNIKGSDLRGVIKQKPDLNLRTGELIQTQDGGVYKILGIEFPCNPKSKWIGLCLEKHRRNK